LIISYITELMYMNPCTYWGQWSPQWYHS